jgi:cytochrome P450/CRP-like cAMP-binding protein
MSDRLEGLPRPPLVPGWPLIGNAIELAKKPAMFWVEAAETYGPAYRVRFPTAPGGELTLLAGLEANRFASRHGHEVFTTKEYYHRLVRETGTPNYICALDGPDHTHFRREMKTAFSREAMSPFVADMTECVAERVRAWRPGEIVGVMDWVQRATLDALSIAASGCPMQDDTYAALGRYAATFVGSGVAGQPDFLFRAPGYQRAKHAVDAFLAEELTKHEEVPRADRHGDLMDTVLDARDPDGQPFGHHDRVANAHLPYANGYIYGGRICAFLIYALLRHPDVLNRVRAEIDTAFAEGPLSVRKLSRMVTLRNAVRETYRRYPVAPAVPRFAAKSFEFEGYRVEQGSTVFIAIVAPHFDSRYFAEPYRFDPDRFGPPRSEHRRPYAYSPYGLGRHVCLSIGMVETVVMTTISAILHAVDLRITPEDYQIQTQTNPVPGPHRNFSVEVVGRRTPPVASPDVLAEDDELEFLLRIDLPDDEQEAMRQQIERRTYEPGISIIHQGEPADRFFVIAEGEVEVLQRTDGPPKRTAVLRAGDFFGELGLLQGKPRNASIRAIGDRSVRVLALDRALFLRIVADFDLTSNEIAAMARRREAAVALRRALPGAHADAIRDASDTPDGRTFASGEVVVRHGDPSEHVFVILHGWAEVLAHTEGEPFVLARLETGDFFGEIGLLQQRPRAATVRAGSDGLGVLALDREAFGKLLENASEQREELLVVVAQRLAQMASAKDERR